MRTRRLIAASLVATCIASSVGCYYPSAYPSQYQATSYGGDSKGGIDYGPTDAPPPPPATGRYVVDPAVAIAGVAAAGLLGYAIGNNNNNRYYGPVYGGAYYRPGPRYYGPGRPGVSYGVAYNSYRR